MPWSLWTVANAGIVVALVTSILSGVGYLLGRQVEKDRTGLTIALVGVKQAITLEEKKQPRYNSAKDGDVPVFCVSARGKVVLSHNQKGKKPIQVTVVALDFEKVDPGKSAHLAYEINPDEMPPHGVTEVRQYFFTLNGQKAEARLILDKDNGVTVNAKDVLTRKDKVEAVSLTPEGENASFPFGVAIETKSAGLYRVWFQCEYLVGGSPGIAVTEPVYIYMR